MPSFTNYKKSFAGNTIGMNHKSESDMVMEMSWNNDISSKTAYFYDYYHDDEKLNYSNLHPERSKTKTPIDIKFLVTSYNSENKDQVGYHIQFKPSFNWEDEIKLKYYKDVFANKYMAEFPVGLYVDIPDEKGVYRKWIVTEPANWLDNQFLTWYVLPVDHVFQWIYEGVKYQMCGVSRSQNS